MSEGLVSAVLDVARRHATPDVAEETPLELDSLAIVGFVVDVERSLGVRFPSELMRRETFATAASVARALDTLTP